MSDRNDTSDWDALCPDLGERILLLLPVSEAVRLAGVCKSWLSVMEPCSFSTQLSRLPAGKRPWLFLWGISELSPHLSAVFAYDPMAGRWFRIPTVLPPPDVNCASLGGTNGAFFAFSGSRVCFTQTPIILTWKETSPALYARCSALMGTIGSPHSPPFKFVTFGGLVDDGHRILEIYDSLSHTWESCNTLPEGAFLDGISSDSMSSAILGSQFYVTSYDGYVASFDVDLRAWSRVHRLSIPGLVSVFIVAGNAELLALCVCRGHKGECLKMFKVDVVTMDCEELSEMPSKLFSLFEDADEMNGASLKCIGSGGMVYVYSEQYYKGCPVCICEMNEGRYEWSKLPPLPSPPHFDRVVCCHSVISPRDCFKTFATKLARVEDGVNIGA